MVYEAQLLIDGRSVTARREATFSRSGPIGGGAATVASAASVGDALAAANAAAAAFPSWSTTPASERASILEHAADLLESRQDEFAAVMARELGATPTWAGFNCSLGAAILRDAATRTDCLGDTGGPAAGPAVTNLAVRQPAGVVLGIAPWNAPIVLSVRAVAVPLACANTVVLKASELCPKTHSLVAETLNDAGLPPGVLNLVSNAPDDAAEIIEALVAHAAVRRVSFTGSTRVGRSVAEICARHLKPCLLELSGKAPLLLLDDADIEAAADAASYGAFFNQGQVCISTERVIVDEAVAADFVAQFATRASALRAGDPSSGRHALGAMIGTEAANRVGTLVEDALAKGATLVCGGQRDDAVMQPTIIDHVTSTMRLYHEESFGPVAAVIRVAGVEEAIAVANDSDYGLAAAVFGRDTARALAVARRLETGIAHVNGPTVYDEPHMPFGGMKASGHGRFGGDSGVQAFTELRWISLHRQAHDYPI
ncbi:MAG: aldehyde dehydrogenase [Alphaproteobacteria bacterium]